MAAQAMHVLETRQLLIGYAGRALCAPIDLSVSPGNAVFVVGVNGAGKSTFLRTCLGLHPPIDGYVRLMGKNPNPASPSQRTAVARDLGEEAFFPALSVREHLSMVCFGHGVDEGPILDPLLSALGLDAVSDAIPDRLSSGQRRRLALAAVLVRPRRLLVLDEPEQRLDMSARAVLAERLLLEREAGCGLLIASHDPALVATCASTVLLLGKENHVLSADQGAEALKEGG